MLAQQTQIASIKAGSSSQSVLVFITNSSTGLGLTGLAYNTSGLAAYYSFGGASAGSIAITLATLSSTTSAYASGGFIQIDSTHMPGWYRLDLPSTMIASGKGRVVALNMQGATNMSPLAATIELTGWDSQDGVRGGMTALPNTACTANASLLTSGTGTDQIYVTAGKVNEVGSVGTVTTCDSCESAVVSGYLEGSTTYTGGLTAMAQTVSGVVHKHATTIFVDPANGSDFNSGLYPGAAVSSSLHATTLASGYTNAVMVLFPGTSEGGEGLTYPSMIGAGKQASFVVDDSTSYETCFNFAGTVYSDFTLTSTTGAENTTLIGMNSPATFSRVTLSGGDTGIYVSYPISMIDSELYTFGVGGSSQAMALNNAANQSISLTRSIVHADAQYYGGCPAFGVYSGGSAATITLIDSDISALHDETSNGCGIYGGTVWLLNSRGGYLNGNGGFGLQAAQAYLTQSGYSGNNGNLTAVEDLANVQAIQSGLQLASSAVTLPDNAPSTFLDGISTADPSGASSGWNFRQCLVWLFRRFGKAATDKTALTLKVYGSDGSTVLSTQAITSDGAISNDTTGAVP